MYTIICTFILISITLDKFRPNHYTIGIIHFYFSMKKVNVTFWIVTGLMAAFVGFGSVYDIINNEMVQGAMSALGYPMYLAPFLGVMKLLGVAAVLYQKWPKLTEWAYAGLTLELIGGAYSHLAAGQGFGASIPALIALVLVVGSYCLNQKRMKA